jgi:hypothetical protein
MPSSNPLVPRVVENPYPARHIHLDFHTPPQVRVGDSYDAGEFVRTLRRARVNSIAVFCTCHHGLSYFDTATGTRHPGLDFDLYGRIAEACRQAGIALLAYFSMNVNEAFAAAHPQAHALRADGTPVNSQILQDGTELFWTWMCPNRTDWFEAFFLPHVDELLGLHPADGIFVDMGGYLPGSCFCEVCLDQMKRAGLDPHDPLEHAEFNYRTSQRCARDLRKLLDARRAGLRLQMGCYIGYGQAPRASESCSEFYLESLPYQMGWDYLPIAARHYRNYGLPTMGMTGRFLKNWGDFGTVVSPAQLKTQVAMHLMAGLASAVGDHMHCDGRLSEGAYSVIGEAFDFLEPRQEHLVGMEPAREVAVLAPGALGIVQATKTEQMGSAAFRDGYRGACKAMTELHRQWDVVTESDALQAYPTVILNHAPREAQFVRRLEEHLRGGALAIAAGIALGGEESGGCAAWQELTGAAGFSLGEYDGEFYELSDPSLAGELPKMPHYVHLQAVDVDLPADAEVLADAWRPPFPRDRSHHYGHFQGPATDRVGPAIAVRKIGAGHLVLIRPQVFAAYLQTGYWVHREMIGNLLETRQPARVLRTNAPSTVELTLGFRNGRRVLQALPFQAERRYRESFESLAGQPLSVEGVWVEILGVADVQRAFDPVTGRDVNFEATAGGTRIHLPEFNEHLLILVE